MIVNVWITFAIIVEVFALQPETKQPIIIKTMHIIFSLIYAQCVQTILLYGRQGLYLLCRRYANNFVDNLLLCVPPKVES